MVLRTRHRVLLASLMLSALCPGLAAQTTGRISGTVTDPSGAVIAGAHIVVHTSTTGESRTLYSDATGSFSAVLLRPGLYVLTLEAPGFQPRTVRNVPVNVTETTIVNVGLGVGAARESVTVIANSQLLQTAGPQLGRIVDRQGVAELPLATRNFTQLLFLSPGTATYLPDSTGVGRNTQAISVNGARVTQNNYQINGIDVNTLGTNGPILVPVPAPETIQEFKVQTSLYDATYGRAGGANIQVLTRAGSNEVHGSLYEYLRNDALNANDSFLKAAGVERPVLRRNVFGTTLGGPLRRDRIFYFLSYQGARETNGASLVNSISSNVLVAPGLTDDRSQATLQATFHPPGAIDPVALALLNAKLPDGGFLIPTPGPNGRFTATSPSFFQEDQFNANLDWTLSARDSMSFRFFFANTSQDLALPSFRGAGSNVPGFGSDGTFNNRVVALQQVHAFSPTVFNEARIGYSFNRNDTNPRELVTDISVGISRANANQFPGLPMIRIAPGAGGVIVGTSPTTDPRAAPSTTTFNDTVSFTVGKHSLRAGGEIRYNLINFTLGRFTRGQIDFQDFSSFLSGTARSTTLGTGILDRAWRAFDHNLFAQDDWKISPRLTLNFGLRYELDLPVYDTRGRLATFDPALYEPRPQVNASNQPIGPPTGGMIQAGNVIATLALASLPRGEDSLLHSVDPHNLAPRVGFAANVKKGLVLRGGYGLYYSRPTFQYASASNTLPPYYALGIRNNPSSFADPFFPLPPADQFPTFVPGVALAGTAFDRDQRVPYFHQFNLTTQVQFGPSWLLETGYVGSRGRRLFRQVAINQAVLASPLAPVTNRVTGAVITTNSADNAQLRAPFQGVSMSGFFLNQSDTNSSYDSLQVSLARRFAAGTQLQASYTFAKSLDDGSGAGGGAGISGLVNPGAVGDSGSILGDQRVRRANRGVSDFSRRHRLVISYLWSLPIARVAPNSAFARHLLSDWSVAGVVTAMSGLPVDIVDTGSGSLYGLANGSSPLARPDFAPGEGCAMAKANVPSGYFFNPYAFRSPVVLAGQPIPSSGGTATAAARATDIGNVPRNCITGPSQVNVDFAVERSWRWRESGRLVFRAEFFNLPNHANLANPISNLNAASVNTTSGLVLQPGNFGRIISSSANPRLVQLALRISF